MLLEISKMLFSVNHCTLNGTLAVIAFDPLQTEVAAPAPVLICCVTGTTVVFRFDHKVTVIPTLFFPETWAAAPVCPSADSSMMNTGQSIASSPASTGPLR